MLTYDMERRGRLPLYDYLCRCIKEDIWNGALGPGEKLPSKRALARHLEVAVATVENAYSQLVAEGYLYAEEKRGYFVSPLETGDRPRPAEAVHASGPACALPMPQRDWLLDLTSGGAGTEGFPFTVWARLMRRVLTDRGEQLLRSSPHNGVEDPGYPKAGKVYGLHGARCVPLALDESGVPVEAVERSGVQVVHLSPSHQFPSGVVMPIARRQSLLRWAEEEPGRYLIEDDYDSEFRFTGRPIPPLQNIDRAGRVIYMNTFSRSLAPSLRISYMVLPPALLERYQRTLGFYSCTVPAMEQYTLARFLSEGYFETHVNRMRGFYRGRRDQVLDALSRSPLAGRYQVRGEDAGLHFLLRLETERDDRSLARAAEERQIRLSFLSDYGGGESHVLVVSYPGIELARLPEALAHLAELL